MDKIKYVKGVESSYTGNISDTINELKKVLKQAYELANSNEYDEEGLFVKIIELLEPYIEE